MPTYSLVFTVNDRPTKVLEKAFQSIPEGSFDEIVMVLDRTPDKLKWWLIDYWHTRHERRFIPVTVDGPPGWICPVNAWNEGFKQVTSEYTICFSSEVIFEEGAISTLKKRLSGIPSVVYGKCRDSGEFGPVSNNPSDPSLLCSSAYARPLGFIYGLPTWALRVTGGMNDAFMGGYWYDDDDWCMRLWSVGLPFVFADNVSGIHQAHKREKLETPEGQAGIERNRKLMISLWGVVKPWDASPKLWAEADGVSVAVPRDISLLHAAWGRLCG